MYNASSIFKKMLKITALRLHFLCLFYIKLYVKFKMSFLKNTFPTHIFNKFKMKRHNVENA